MSRRRDQRTPRLIRKILEAASAKSAEAVGSGVDFVGDIGILRLSGMSSGEKVEVAEALLREVKNVRCVYEQSGGIEGEYRLRSLRHLAGEDRTVTVHRENGFAFELDVRTCYFSPRLSAERMRVARSVEPGDTVVNMFAGVGPYSIPLAKKADVTSCELNEAAFGYHLKNNRRNKVEGRIGMFNLDARRLSEAVKGRFDRVLMPHPSRSHEFLPAALDLAKEGSTIYYYRHLSAEDRRGAEDLLSEELRGLLPGKCRFSTRMVREVGPRFIELVAEIEVRT